MTLRAASLGSGNSVIVGATAGLGFLIDGGGSAITSGTKGYISIPFACSIVSATLLADQSGSCVLDLWRCTYAQFDAGSTHPVVGDSITASAQPTLSSANKYQDTTLTGWTTMLNADDVLAFHLNSSSTIQRLTIALGITRS